MEEENIQDEDLITKLQNLTKDHKVVARMSPIFFDEPLAWQRSLYFKVFSEKKVRKISLIQVLMRVWKRREIPPHFREVAEDVWQATFTEEEDLLQVLNWAPWHFEGDLILLARGKPERKPGDYKFTHTPLWVQIYDLPQEYQSYLALLEIGKQLGRVLQVENNNARNGRYCRIRIDWEVTLELRSYITVISTTGIAMSFALKYEKLPKFCFFCAKMGHEKHSCSKLQAMKKIVDSMHSEENKIRARELLVDKVSLDIRSVGKEETFKPHESIRGGAKGNNSSTSTEGSKDSSFSEKAPWKEKSIIILSSEKDPIDELLDSENATEDDKGRDHPLDAAETELYNLEEAADLRITALDRKEQIPESDYLMLIQVDAAVLTRYAFIAMIGKDKNDRLLFWRVQKVISFSADDAKTQAIKAAIEFALDHEDKNITIISDAYNPVSAINNLQPPQGESLRCCEEARNLLQFLQR